MEFEPAWVNHDRIDLIEGGLVGVIRGARTEVLDDFLGDWHGHLFLLECAAKEPKRICFGPRNKGGDNAAIHSPRKHDADFLAHDFRTTEDFLALLHFLDLAMGRLLEGIGIEGRRAWELDLDLGTDVRLNSVEAEARNVEETLDLQQGKLVLGFRLGDCMEDPVAEDLAAIRVFNECYGGCVTSRLFKNVREKLSLCYYASSMLEVHKGLLFVSSGIRPENREVAQAEILRQLDCLRSGDLTEEELTAAINSLSSSYRSLRDSQGALESYYVNNALDGLLLTPEEMAELVEAVTAQDVQRIARSVVLDLVYFLHGEAPDEEEEGEMTDD